MDELEFQFQSGFSSGRVESDTEGFSVTEFP